jgi:predicted ATPase
MKISRYDKIGLYVLMRIRQEMITRIEIDGFKSFRQFAMDLRPFQVIIGQNGVGKSNLFDALILLSRLASGDSLFDAFTAGRGSVLEQFALLEDGSRSKQMQFAVELLLPKQTERTEFITQTRLRYELRIIRHEEPQANLYIDYEMLAPIKPDSDKWLQTEAQKAWLINYQYIPIITTEPNFFVLHEGDLFGRTEFSKENANMTTLSRTDYNPLIAGFADTIKHWRSLQFNPSLLQQAASGFAPAVTLLPDGSNLAAVLYRMSKEDEFALNDIARDMMNLNQNFKAISVDYDSMRDELFFRVQGVDGNWLSPKVLSDGTLRTLAFVTLRNDPNYEGVLCIEEPENGVHPLVLEKLVKMFKSMATDWADTEMPLRQIILNTHSPSLLAYVDMQDIAYMYMPRHNPTYTAVGTVTDKADEAKRLFTKHQITNFLNAAQKQELDHA